MTCESTRQSGRVRPLISLSVVIFLLIPALGRGIEPVAVEFPSGREKVRGQLYPSKSDTALQEIAENQDI